MTQVLQFSDRVFLVAHPSQVTESLFKGPTTASGTFKVRKNGIELYDLKANLRAFIVANSYQERFIVSCGKVQLKNGKTKTRYMYTLCDSDELWLGIRGMSLTERSVLARLLWGEVRTLAPA